MTDKFIKGFKPSSTKALQLNNETDSDLLRELFKYRSDLFFLMELILTQVFH